MFRIRQPILYFPNAIFYVNINGVWKTTIPYININGVWKTLVPFINITGVWK